MTKNIDRKQIAVLFEEIVGTTISVQQVKTNEKLWGLHEARVPDVNKRTVRYRQAQVIAILRTLAATTGTIGSRS